MVAKLGYGTFIFFGAVCFAGAAFVYFVVPETKNLTLEEMDEVFGDEAGSGAADRKRLEAIYVELGLFTAEDLSVQMHEEKKNEYEEDRLQTKMEEV
jgi:hypothetical protein